MRPRDSSRHAAASRETRRPRDYGARVRAPDAHEFATLTKSRARPLTRACPECTNDGTGMVSRTHARTHAHSHARWTALQSGRAAPMPLCACPAHMSAHTPKPLAYTRAHTRHTCPYTPATARPPCNMAAVQYGHGAMWPTLQHGHRAIWPPMPGRVARDEQGAGLRQQGAARGRQARPLGPSCARPTLLRPTLLRPTLRRPTLLRPTLLRPTLLRPTLLAPTLLAAALLRRTH